jgi:hypothetical protein
LPRKKKTIAKLVDDTAILLQKLVKLKASDANGYCQCVTCGAIDHWKNMQGGHYIQRKWTATKLMEENIHVQCPACNGGFGGRPKGNLGRYALYLEDMYGREFVEELEILKHQTKKYTRAEVLEIQTEFKDKIRELEI